MQTETASNSAPRPTRGAAARAWDAVVDVVSVTLGLERRRDIAAEYESGERAYPWVCYPEPATGRTMYYNSLSGVQTEIQPPDWERFSKPESYVRPDEEAGALRVATPAPSAWSRTVSALGAAPIIASAVKVGEVRKRGVGSLAAAAAIAAPTAMPPAPTPVRPLPRRPSAPPPAPCRRACRTGWRMCARSGRRRSTRSSSAPRRSSTRCSRSRSRCGGGAGGGQRRCGC